jgi:hypothetical protein
VSGRSRFRIRFCRRRRHEMFSSSYCLKKNWRRYKLAAAKKVPDFDTIFGRNYN